MASEKLYNTTKEVLYMTYNQELLSIIVDMIKASRCCQRDDVFCGGITFTQFNILDIVCKKNSITMSELNKVLSVEKSTSTRLVEPLVKQGLVLRERSEKDSRVIYLKLSPKGEEVHTEILNCINQFLDKVLNEIPEDKRDIVIDNTKILIEAIRKTFDNCC